MFDSKDIGSETKHVLSVLTWASYWTSLPFSFSIHKMWLTIITIPLYMFAGRIK